MRPNRRPRKTPPATCRFCSATPCRGSAAKRRHGQTWMPGGYTFPSGFPHTHGSRRDAEDARVSGWVASGLQPERACILHGNAGPTSLPHQNTQEAHPMQRWLKTPRWPLHRRQQHRLCRARWENVSGRLDDDGNDAGPRLYSVPIGTDVMRDHYLTVQGTKGRSAGAWLQVVARRSWRPS